MTTYEILELMRYIDVRNMSKTRREAIDKLSTYEGDLRIFVLPLCKVYWEGGAEILEKIGYPRVKPIIKDILRWYQDTNWPGIERIGKFLCAEVPKEILIENVSYVMKEAIKLKDEDWIYFLEVFAEKAGIADSIYQPK